MRFSIEIEKENIVMSGQTMWFRFIPIGVALGHLLGCGAGQYRVSTRNLAPKVLETVNEFRETQGLNPLEYNNILNTTAHKALDGNNRIKRIV